jgi:hypothetical protein
MTTLRLNRLTLTLSALGLFVGIAATPVLAQDKMGKMDKMSGEKMKMGKMAGDKMGKMMSGLSEKQKTYMEMKMNKMGSADKKAMMDKMATMTPAARRKKVEKMMSSDKMGKMGGKM